MRISYNWLKELLPGLTHTPQQVAELLTMRVFETTVVHEYVIDPKVKIVRIEKIEPHPNADRLQLATVTDGQKSIRVVCGAPNIKEGQIVPYAPPDTTAQDQNGKPFVIKEAVIRGEKSPGMLASPRELGLGADHGGILVLPNDAPLGSMLAEYLPGDSILEAEVTPNRAHDCLSHVGIARELAALLELEVKEPVIESLPEPQREIEGFTLAVEDTDMVPRYMNLVMKGVTTQISPLWMQARLFAMNTKPRHALIDITNYVMFEVGNPSHAFDASKLPGKTMEVRQSRKDEKLSLLDGTSLELTGEELVITNDDVPVALAGIMGGSGTEVEESTDTVVLEIANFYPYIIQQAVSAHAIRTEAATRFLKGLDPNIVQHAAERLAKLYADITGGEVLGVLDAYPRPRVQTSFPFRPSRVGRLAGGDITPEQSRQVLERLRFLVEEEPSKYWKISAPTDRLDIEGEHDALEEVIRVIGFDAIPAQFDATQLQPLPLPDRVYWRESLRDLLRNQGMTEVYNYTFEDEKMAALRGVTDVPHLALKNPVAPEQKYLRVSLLPNLLKNLIVNKAEFHSKFTKRERALFEIGDVMWSEERADQRILGVEEELRLGAVMVTTLQEAKDIVENLLELMRLEGITWQERQGVQGMWAGGSYELIHEGEIIGVLGALNEQALKKIKYTVPVSAFELRLGLLLPHTPEVELKASMLKEVEQEMNEAKNYIEINRFPTVLRDISMLVPAKTSPDEVQELIERVGGELVRDTELFDEFEPAGGDQKSLAFHVEYQAPDKTLTDAEVNELHGKIIMALEEEFEAQIR